MKKILAFAVVAISFHAHSQEVLNVKDKKALMSFPDEMSVPAVDDEVYATDNGKKVGIIKVTTVKGLRAIGMITKGRANQGMQIEAKGTVQKNEPASTKIGESWAVLGGMSMQSMSAQVTGVGSTATTSMSGTNFLIGASYQFPYSKKIVLEGDVFWENYSLTGTITYPPGCTSSTSCNVSISYLAGYGLVKYYFLTGKFRAYAFAGMGLLQPISKSSNVLDSNAISFTQNFPLGAGLDWQMNKKYYIPVRIQYNYFMSSSTVTTSAINVIGGFGMNF